MLRFDIATLFVDMCRSVVHESIIGRAIKAGKLEVHVHNIREFAFNRQNRVDDSPYGGGMGMLMQADPIYLCYQDICLDLPQNPYVIYMSPQGKPLTQQKAVELSKMDNILIICGHYEGVDQRVIDEIVDEELSIGDFVLTGGELAALTVVDCVGRLCEGVLKDESCFTEESHWNGLLEYPQYTRPPVWHGMEVPEILLSGHHENIEKWRRQQSLRNTYLKRPDLLKTAELTKQDKQYLKQLKEEQDEKEADRREE